MQPDHHKHRKAMVVRVCLNCGDRFNIWPSQAKLPNKGKYCSGVCLSVAGGKACMVPRMTGKISPQDRRKKAKAHYMVKRAIELGELKRLPCEVCGNENSQGHHDDYDKPLDVRWLCPKHHFRRHVELGWNL